MSKIPTPAAATGFVASSKQALGHAADAGKSAFGAGKDIAANANRTVADTIKREKGVWGAVKYGAREYPLVAGAAAVGTAYVAGTAIMGSNRQRVLEARGAQQELQR